MFGDIIIGYVDVYVRQSGILQYGWRETVILSVPLHELFGYKVVMDEYKTKAGGKQYVFPPAMMLYDLTSCRMQSFLYYL